MLLCNMAILTLNNIVKGDDDIDRIGNTINVKYIVYYLRVTV